MIIPILFGDDELQGAEYESSWFGKTQFDVAAKSLAAFFRSLKSQEAEALAAVAKKILQAYVEVAMQARGPYSQYDLDTWIKRLMSKGYSRAQALIFLNGLRKLHDSGSVGAAVWNPYAWGIAHPEDQSLISQFTGGMKSTFWYALAAGAVLLFAYSAPAGVARAFVDRKKVK